MCFKIFLFILFLNLWNNEWIFDSIWNIAKQVEFISFIFINLNQQSQETEEKREWGMWRRRIEIFSFLFFFLFRDNLSSCSSLNQHSTFFFTVIFCLCENVLNVFFLFLFLFCFISDHSLWFFLPINSVFHSWCFVLFSFLFHPITTVFFLLSFLLLFSIQHKISQIFVFISQTRSSSFFPSFLPFSSLTFFLFQFVSIH